MIATTAFHARTAAANPLNAWVSRNGVALAAVYADRNDEALAARTRVAIADMGARWQLTLEGPRAIELLRQLLTRDVSSLAPGAAIKALWLADGGGVRGAAAVARYGNEAFWLLSASSDHAWIAAAATLFGVSVRDISAERCGLAVVGPYARATLEAAGIQADLTPLGLRKICWRGLDMILSRFGEHGGYEVWSGAADALIVWDGIVQAGSGFGLVPVGARAQDVLDVEGGIPRPFRDYIPAVDVAATEPSPWRLGLGSLIEPEHTCFNGRAQLMKTRQIEPARFMGLQIESERAAPRIPVIVNGRAVGRTLSSCYSPALHQAIALAQIEGKFAKSGASVTLNLPLCLQSPEICTARATVVDLPFLRPPDALPE